MCINFCKKTGADSEWVGAAVPLRVPVLSSFNPEQRWPWRRTLLTPRAVPRGLAGKQSCMVLFVKILLVIFI